MNFNVTGSGKSLYWLTCPLAINDKSAVYLLDTGGRITVTKIKIGDSPSGFTPTTVHYGSGDVVGYRHPANFTLEKDIRISTEVLHNVKKFPFDSEIDGILGLLPGSNITKLQNVHSVQFDFLGNKLHFNKPFFYTPTICQNVDHPLFPNRVWLHGDMLLKTTKAPQLWGCHDVWFMLDTGATVSVSFFDKHFRPIDTCDTSRELHTLEIIVSGQRISKYVPRDSLWPACLPHQADRISFVILGIQFLKSLKGFHYEIWNDKVQNVCLRE